MTPNGAHDLPCGTELAAGYTVLAAISSGAMGAVYRAQRRDTGELVALKRLLDPGNAARFEIEARLLTRLHHPRVVGVIDHFDEESGSYLVMELIEGTDLNRLMADRPDGRLAVAEAVEYTRHACEALDYVHSQQIVHRDVKPRNLILGERGVVLVDFGIARELAPDSPGTVIGTPQFMAPEVLCGGAASQRSDVFGIAATLATLILGTPPSYGERTELRRLVSHVSPAIEGAVCDGLELDPDRRIPSIRAFARALDAPLDGAPPGRELALSVTRASAPPHLLQAIVRAAAGVFEAAAASLALAEPDGGGLVYEAAWGAGADEILGVRLDAGVGLAGAVARDRRSAAIAECRTDPRFAAAVAAGTGYVPHTMLVVPLVSQSRAVGVLSLLDRRDGAPYTLQDVPRAELFGELALAALEGTSGRRVVEGEVPTLDAGG